MPSHAMMTQQSSHQSSDGNHDLITEPLVLTSSHYSDGSDTSINDPRSTIIQPTTVPVDGLSAVAADDGYGFAATPPYSPQSDPTSMGATIFTDDITSGASGPWIEGDPGAVAYNNAQVEHQQVEMQPIIVTALGMGATQVNIERDMQWRIGMNIPFLRPGSQRQGYQPPYIPEELEESEVHDQKFHEYAEEVNSQGPIARRWTDEDNRSMTATSVEGSQYARSMDRASQMDTYYVDNARGHGSVARDRYDELARQLNNQSLELMQLRSQAMRWASHHMEQQYEERRPPEVGENSDEEQMPALIDGDEGEPTGARWVEDPTTETGGYFLSPIQLTTVNTILAEAANKGSMKIEVVCPVGMKMGQKIRIGTRVFEDNVIVKVGPIGQKTISRLRGERDVKFGHVDLKASIQLKTPLMRNHEAWSGVIIIDEAPRIPQSLFPEMRSQSSESQRLPERLSFSSHEFQISPDYVPN